MKPYDIEVLVSPLVTVNKKRTKKNNFILISRFRIQVIIELKNARIVIQIIPIPFYKILTSIHGNFTEYFSKACFTNNCG